MAVVAKSSSESLELLPALSFLSLPTEIRHAIFSCIVPSSMLHISRPGCLLNEKAEDKLYSVACRHMTDVEWIAAALPELHAQEYSSIGRWINFPNHLACIMSGIGCQPRAHSGWLSLLLTSRFIYREFLPILYSRLKFSFHDWAVFSRFFSVVPADNQAHIRALCVAWGSEAPFRASRTQQITDAMSAEWRGIWSTIQGLPELLSDLDVFVTVRYGMDRTFYKDLPDSEEKALLHEPLRKIQLAPKGRFIVTEIIEARLSTEQIQWTKLTRQVAPAYSIGEPPEERLEFYSKFPFELRWIYSWGKIPSRLEWESRQLGLLDDSRIPPWHGGFNKRLEQLSIRKHTLLECMALESLLILQSGRCHWEPRTTLRRGLILPMRRALAERERLAAAQPETSHS